jgi:hypothetical protein
LSDFFDFDPLTNVRQDFEYDETTGEVSIHYSSDESALVDYNQRLRDSGCNDKDAIKANWWTYAKIPAIFFLKMRARGFKLDGSDDTTRLLAEINTNYPALKCTQLNHGKKLKVIHDMGSNTTTEGE